ncbi:MAG: DUF1345 domain-containing protein [Herbiconiux sp.]|uniref:DUF1345 domain-containing protein n=1 Tax=Herbiconiux sp. TaxID=1871186 RepID=UPI0011F57D2A|nr:DUF1345 domain-containing protein [Herbiconiux sp.]TAJ46068.1 MAG: DUF1345 domain-containing protein [Herbiconiux sp.]
MLAGGEPSGLPVPEPEPQAAPHHEPGTSTKRGWLLVGFILSSLAQLGLVALGLSYLFDESDFGGAFILLTWCLAGSLYVLVAVIVLGRLSRQSTDRPLRPSRLEVGRVARVVAFVSTILTSLIGVAAAIQLVSYRSDPEWGQLTVVVGVWAMVLSWGLLHWGFAQIYYQDYYKAAEPIMRFPSTPYPRLVDFVYFSFTLGTSFAASDIEVQSSRLRWRVVWHSVISFFFNGLIIVFALNSILSAGG